MTDYKELAARLRRKAPLLDYSHAAMDYIAAADAIEELLTLVEEYKEKWHKDLAFELRKEAEVKRLLGQPETQ